MGRKKVVEIETVAEIQVAKVKSGMRGAERDLKKAKEGKKCFGKVF